MKNLISIMFCILGLFSCGKGNNPKPSKGSHIESLSYSFYGTMAQPIYDFKVERVSAEECLVTFFNHYLIAEDSLKADISLMEELEKAVEEHGVKKYKQHYTPRMKVLDGNSWSLEIIYDDKTRIHSSGTNAYPKGLGRQTICELVTPVYKEKEESSKALLEMQELDELRQDPELISSLEAYAEKAIGNGAVCIDPVKHLVKWQGRYFYCNNDCGGVLEIPDGWTAADDRSTIYAPDSSIIVSIHSDKQTAESEDALEKSSLRGLQRDSITMLSTSRAFIDLPDATQTPVFTIIGFIDDDWSYYSRDIFKDNNGIGHSIKVRWQQKSQTEARALLKSVNHFPLGPEGQLPAVE